MVPERRMLAESTARPACAGVVIALAIVTGAQQKTPVAGPGFFVKSGAGNEARTRDLNLGKVALYQLSYSRVKLRL